MESMYARVAEVEISYRPMRCARPKIEDGRVAASIFRANWDDGQIEFRESLKVMLLNNRCNCMGICTVASGGGTSCGVDVRNILQTALVGNAQSIILCHNHPSGNVEPSTHDNTLTSNVQRGCDAVGIKLLDHVIISPDEDVYYSFKENGKL